MTARGLARVPWNDAYRGFSAVALNGLERAFLHAWLRHQDTTDTAAQDFLRGAAHDDVGQIALAPGSDHNQIRINQRCKFQDSRAMAGVREYLGMRLESGILNSPWCSRTCAGPG